MKFISILLFSAFATHLVAQIPDSDSLINYILANSPEKYIEIYAKDIIENSKNSSSSNKEHLLRTALLLIAYDAAADSINAQKLRDELLTQKLTTGQRHEVLHFLFDKGGDFIHQRPVYLASQQLGILLAKNWQETRTQFSFLENLLGLQLFTKNTEQKKILLSQMKQVSAGDEYLSLRTDYHYADYYRTIRNDSCVFFFENYIDGIKLRLGKENPYFLQKTEWIKKTDSGMLANAYRGYAVYATEKGELKRAGELLILADQTIPDTSFYELRKVENQISLSTLYADLVNKEKAIEYAEKAIALCDKNDYIKLRNGRVASVYARALFINEKYNEASLEYEKAYTYYLNGLSTIDPKKQALYLAINAIYARDMDGSRQWKQKASIISCEPNDEIQYLTATVEGLSGLYEPSKQTLSFLLEAKRIAEENKNARWLRESQYHLYLLHKDRGRLRESLAYYENYVQIHDSLYRSGQEMALSEIDGKYLKSIQDEQIVTLNAKNEMNTARIEGQKKVFTAGAIALAILCVLLVALFSLYKKIKENHAIILRSNEEKNILLKEIHHRVKNNLQVISSLLKLQSGYIKDDAAIQAIAEGRSRVQSMALLHQNLYKEDNLTGVNMKEYFDNLIQGLFDTYNISADRIRLHKNIAPLSLDVDTVVPLGLITNELISNALKHAFTGTGTGNLYVELYEINNTLILKVRDDGKANASSSGNPGFGTKLIQSLSNKLEADIKTKTDNGTEVMLEIKDYKKAA